MRGKCERGRGSANADGGSVNAGAEVQTRTGRVRKASRAMGACRGRLSAPWLRFHGADRADVYIIIHVRACCCGECALNPPTSPPIPRRRPSPAPAQRHALPEHFRSPTQRDAFLADPTTHSPPKAVTRPRTATRPSRALLITHATPTHARRLCEAFPAALTTHSPSKPFARPRTATRPSRTLPLAHAAPTHTRRLRDARPLPSQPIPRRRPSLAPTQRHALAEHFRSPTQRQRTPAGCAIHSPPKAVAHSPQRRPASPSVPLRAQKNGTAQWMCDAECLGRPSLRSVIGVGEPRAVRRRCGALAWRVGLRPQPWALRSRRCGRVLRA